MTAQEQRGAVVAEALEWVGTPYHENARLKGIGVDCAMLLAEVYERAQVVPPIDPGDYSPDFALHHSEEIFLSWLERYAKETTTPRAGDVACFKFGRCFSHGAILTDDGGTIVHAMKRDRAVVLGRVGDGFLAERDVKFFTLWDG
jgi:cell wall-associated NlpC family hydrolase